MTIPDVASETARPQAPQSDEPSWGAKALDSLWSTVKSPIVGARQVFDHAPNQLNESNPFDTAQSIGHMSGLSLLYGGTTIAASFAMGPYARFAAPLVGAALGYFSPTVEDEGVGSRIVNALGGSVMNSIGYGSAKYARNAYLPHMTDELKAGELTTDWVKVGNQYRKFGIRAPENWDPTKPSQMVVAADSSLIASDLLSSKGYMHGMDNVNGFKEAANAYNTFVLYPIAKPRYGGLFRTWDTPDGSISMFGTRSHNDSEYLTAAINRTIKRANIDPKEINAFGYDHGGTLLQYHMGVAPEGTFKNVAVYSSTVSERVPLPKPGTPIQVGHSMGDPIAGTKGDPTLGWDGSRGGVAAIPEKWPFRYTNVMNHKPWLQAPRVAESNGVTATPEWQSIDPEYRVRTWMKDGKPVAQEIGFYRDFHGVPGRKIGGSNESLTSGKNQQGVPPQTSAIDLAFDFFGMKKVGNPAASI
jgi:poly(3-hydroxybutyrate) depolymerase